MSESLKNISEEEKNLREKAIRAIDFKISEEIEKAPEGAKEILGMKEMLHELQVHQVELELQNEELIRTTDRLEESRNKYQDLYEFAPIGYFSLDKEGIIRNVNLTGSSLLKMERKILTGRPFQYYISKDDKDKFHAFLRRVFEKNGKQRCEIKVIDKNEKELMVLLEGVVVGNDLSRECLMAVIDISEQKEAEKIIKASLEEKERLNIIIATQEEERRRISEALHNSIAQLLYAAQIKLEISMDTESKNSDLIQSVHALVQTSLNETRTISFELMPPILRDYGLKETLQEFCNKRWTKDLAVNFLFPGKEKRLDNFIEIAIYRIIQELFNNIEKHAKASKANIYCEIVKNYIKISVEDNGIGFPEGKLSEGESIQGKFLMHTDKMGLRNIRNRVKLMNGIMDIKSIPGMGTSVNIEIPFET